MRTQGWGSETRLSKKVSAATGAGAQGQGWSSSSCSRPNRPPLLGGVLEEGCHSHGGGKVKVVILVSAPI